MTFSTKRFNSQALGKGKEGDRKKGDRSHDLKGDSKDHKSDSENHADSKIDRNMATEDFKLRKINDDRSTEHDDQELKERKCHHKDEGKGIITIDGKEFTREEYQKMVFRRKAGERTIDIANDNNVSRKRLSDKFNQHNIKPIVEKNKEKFRIGGKTFSTAEMNELVMRRQAGKTVIQIASSEGIKKEALRSFFDLNGIKVEGKEGSTYIGRRMYLNAQVEGMIERRKGGESIESIAGENGLAATTLRRFFNDRGVTLEGNLKVKKRRDNKRYAFPRKDVIRGTLQKEVQKRIDEMKREGKSNREIARAFNVSEQDVGRHFIRNKKLIKDGDSVKIGADIRSRDAASKMTDARKRGELIKDIALANGVKEYSLGRYFQRHKVVPEYPGGTVFFGQKAIAKDKMEEIRRRRLKGETIQALATDLGLSLTTLERYFQRRNIILEHSVQREINRKYRIDHDFFNKIDSEKKAYILGLIMTDGNIHKQHNSLRFDFQKRDRELCEIARNSLNSNAKIVEREIKRGGSQVRVQFNSKTLIVDLAKLGVEPGNKTYKNKFPSEFVVPRQYQRDYIRGVLDGDGGVIKYRRSWKDKQYMRYAICLSGTQDLVKGVQHVLIRDAGTTGTKVVKDKRTIDNHSMNYSGRDDIVKIFEYLYPSGFNPEGNCLKRKYDRMKEAHDYWQSRSSGS